MHVAHNISVSPPNLPAEIRRREELLNTLRAPAREWNLEMVPFTAWQEGRSAGRIQGVSLCVETVYFLQRIGSIILLENGEWREWRRKNLAGPIKGSTVIDVNEIDHVINEMVKRYSRVLH